MTGKTLKQPNSETSLFGLMAETIATSLDNRHLRACNLIFKHRLLRWRTMKAFTAEKSLRSLRQDHPHFEV
jgi:hypothetical protein